MRRAPGTRRHEVLRGPVDDLVCLGSAVPEDADVEADVVLESVLGGVAVTGAVRAPWHGSCRRCLAPAAGTVVVRVREHFTPGGDGEETYPLHHDDIDLEPMVRDAVLLELPLAPLCRADCRGLCPSCGVNRNDEVCTCEAQRDQRWAALDALREPGAASGG